MGQSRGLQLWDRVKDSNNEVVKEFLFGNVQIGFKSQGLLYKASCMELGTPYETQPYLFYQTKII